MESLVTFSLIFLVVFVMNVVPAFAPPTWTVLSYVAVRYRTNAIVLALVGAAAATLGRLVLARLSTILIRRKLLSEKARANVDTIRLQLEGRKKMTAGLALFYAFSPLPSNHVFIAYGLTAMRLRVIAAPFFFGRTASYTFWALTSSSVAQWTGIGSDRQGFFFSVYFVIGQIFTIFTVYLFTRIDWQAAFSEKKLRLLKKNSTAAGVAGGSLR